MFFKRRPLQSKSEIVLRDIVVVLMLAFYITFFIIPIGIALAGSFHNWNPLNGKYIFNGVTNYVNLIKNPLFRTSMLNTVLFCSIVIVLRALLGFICAYALYSKLVKGKSFFRAMMYMPVIAPLVAIAFLWKFMYNPQVGLINQILGTDINWLMNQKTSLGSIMAMTVWKDFGYAVVLYMAGLYSLSGEQLEAARVDGCNSLQLLKNIIIPLLRPMTLFIIVTSIISYIQAYVQVLVLTEGGPGTSTYLVSYLIYNEAFVKYNFGSASAMSFVLFLFTAICTVISFRVSGRKEQEGR